MTELPSSPVNLRNRGIRTRAMNLLRRYSEKTRSHLRDDPVGFSKKLLYYLWFTVVLLAILSLLGIDINPFSRSIRASYDSKASSISDDIDIQATDESEEKIEQVLTKSKKSGKRYEISFACEEVDCIESCARHVTKKCKRSEHCLTNRAKECKKKCRRKRCENRCKDAAMSYVEREMKLEQCKESCAANKLEKCKAKCENTYLPCKTKCRNDIKKYVCNREPVLPEVIRDSDSSSPDEQVSQEAFDVETETDV